MLNKMSIRIRFFIIIGLVILLMSSIGFFNLVSFKEFSSRYLDDLNSSEKLLKTVDTARSVQVTFKKQVQEWKDILVRGQNQEAYKKHLDGFNNNEKLVKDGLEEVKGLMKSQGLDTNMVDETIKAHSELGTKYREALKSFDSSNPNSYRVVDDLVKGIDRAATDDIDLIVKQVEEYSNKGIDDSRQNANKEINNYTKVTVIGILTTIAVCSILSIILIRRITKQILDLKLKISDIAEADGDLTKQIEIKSQDEIGQTAEKFNLMLEKTRSTIAEAGDSAMSLHKDANELSVTTNEVYASITEISHAVNQIAQGSIQVTSEVETASNSLSQINDYAKSTVEDMNSVMEQFESTELAINEGRQIVTEQNSHMSETMNITTYVLDSVGILKEKTSTINNIVQTISSISEQTNLLALNAAIEAARAGEQGRGFAVVAEEVRKLAESSSLATKEILEHVTEIEQAVENSIQNVNDASEKIKLQNALVQRTEETFNIIFEKVMSVLDRTKKAAGRMTDVTNQVDELDSLILSISSVAEETSAATEEALTSMEEQTAGIDNLNKMVDNLNLLSENLKDTVQRFKY